MRLARYAFIALAFGLLTGCGPAKLEVTRTFTIDTQTESLILDPQPKPQRITVEFSSTASDVSVYLIKSEDKESELLTTPDKAKTLDSKTGKEGALTADVPANQMTRVIIRGASKKTDVTVKVTNKK
jgi:hypothetical protein